MMEFAGFGEVMLRLTVPAGRRLAGGIPGELESSFGGAEANVCASLGLFGNPVRYLSVLPENALTAAFVLRMRSCGVAMEHLRYGAGRFGVYYVERGAGQRPSNVWYDRDFSAVALAAPEEYDFAAMLDGVGHLHLTGITPALSENACRATLALTREARRRNIRISCDLNYRAKLWRWRAGCAPQELARACLAELAAESDLLIANQHQLGELFGLFPDTPVEADDCFRAEAAAEVARKAAARFPRLQLMALTMRRTHSAEHNDIAAMLYDPASGEDFFAPQDAAGNLIPYRMPAMTDRIGGGDAFAAGLLHALFGRNARSKADAIRFAAAAGCLKHGIAGDVNWVDETEVEQLAQGGNRRLSR